VQLGPASTVSSGAKGATMLTRSFGHGDVLLWFVEVFLFMVWFWLLIRIYTDLFRDHETSGVRKALWVVLVLVFPLIGVLSYLIVRGGGMAAREAKVRHDAQEQFDSYIRSVAGPLSPSDQIQKAKALLDAGAIDRGEFDRLKAKALQ
jgi:hypothetical protein